LADKFVAVGHQVALANAHRLDDDRTTSIELIAAHPPGARMVKAFDTMSAEHLRDYERCGGAELLYGIPVSADDEAGAAGWL
jgi:predicted dinucleotide-binding enzyme